MSARLLQVLQAKCFRRELAFFFSNGEGKYSIYCKQGKQAGNAQKTQTPQGLLGKCFEKQYLGWGLQLMDFLLICWWWCLEISVINLLVLTSLGSTYLWSACTHYPPPGGGGLYFCRTAQRHASNRYVYRREFTFAPVMMSCRACAFTMDMCTV